MSDINKPKKVNGVVFEVKSVQKNSDFSCGRKCGNRGYHDCLIKQYQSGNRDEIKLTVVFINVKNTRKDKYYFSRSGICMTDDDGRMYKAGYCKPENCFPENKNLLEADAYVMPRSQAEIVVTFPEIPEDSEVGEISITEGKETLFFTINGLSDSFLDVPEDEKPEEMNVEKFEGVDGKSELVLSSSEERYRKWEASQLEESLMKVKELIHARLCNIISTAEQIKLENKISNGLYSLQIRLERKEGKEFDSVREEYKTVEKDYNEQIELLKKDSTSDDSVREKVEEMYRLTPREFEEYTCELLKNMGFTKVVLTPYSNDGGVDVLAEKDGEKYAVQCKRYRGTVGSPEMQTFIGAMVNAGVDKGLYITTGMFSFEAERMARKQPIVLINKVKLGRLVLRLSGYTDKEIDDPLVRCDDPLGLYE